MTIASEDRPKPQFLHGRRILLTAFVLSVDEYYYEPVEGWLDQVEVAMYAWHLKCNLKSADGERRYTDSFGRDEILWSSNSILQNMMLRPQWGYTPPHSFDLTRLEVLIDRFIKGCRGMYKANHPVVTIGTAIIPAQGIQVIDPESGMPVGPMATRNRVVVQTNLEEEKSAAVLKHLVTTIRHELTTKE